VNHIACATGADLHNLFPDLVSHRR
jgi:hypothetical protein